MGEKYSDEYCQGNDSARAIMTGAANLKQALIDQTLKELDSWVKAMQSEYEKTHPDRPNDIVVGDHGGWVHRDGQSSEWKIPEAELEQYRNTIRGEYYEWVVPAFERCLTPAPADSDAALDVLTKLKGEFGGTSDGKGNFTLTSPALDRVQQARTAMNEWQGDLQQNFDANFISPLQRVAYGQGQIAAAVYSIFEQNKKLYANHRRCTLELLDKAIEAVKAVGQKSPKPYSVMTLVGISVGTLMSLAFPGAGAAVIIASTMAQSYSPPASKEVELGAATAQEVAFNVSQALSANDSALYENERILKDAFQNCHDKISEARSGTQGALVVPLPNLCDTRPNEITDGSLRPDRVVVP